MAGWEHFSEDELRCKCGCGEIHMSAGFMVALEALRDAFGLPIIVTSGYRCGNHPAERKKSRPGAHQAGMAVDVAVSGKQARRLLRLALEMGFGGIGIDQSGDHRMIHLDTWPGDDQSPRPWIWTYTHAD